MALTRIQKLRLSVGSRSAVVGAVQPSSSHRRNAEQPESLPEAESLEEKCSNFCLSHQCLPLTRKPEEHNLPEKGRDGSVGTQDMAAHRTSSVF